jgi:hypothetical protein
MKNDVLLIMTVGLGVCATCLGGIILALQAVRAAMNSDPDVAEKKKKEGN